MFQRLSNCLFARKRFTLSYLLLFFTLFSFAQTGTVSGTVKDADNKPIDGATIKVKQTKVLTVADKEGNFSIRAVKGDTITISSVSFQSQDFVIGNVTKIDVKLERQTGSLDDVVVIGYGTARKRDVTGAVTSVDLNRVGEVPLTSIDQALAGRAGGVQINQSSGQAGSGTSIRIRGGNSLNGTNEPLFVIDGFPIINDNASFAAARNLGLTNNSQEKPQGQPNGALNWLNPADIQSIEVLKDGSATAIYGSRGANGVIIITTKKGKAGQTKVNFNTSSGISQLNASRIDLMNGSEYAAYSNLSNLEQGLPAFYKDTTIDGRLYPIPSKIGEGTNWVDAIKRNGKVQNYSLDFSGGKEVVFSGSIGYTNQEAPLLGSQFQRANFRLNVQTNLTPWLSLDNTYTYSETKADNSPSDSRDLQKWGTFEAALFSNPAEPIYNPDGTLNFIGGIPSQNFSPRLVFNPISLANDILNRNTVNTIVNNLSLKAKIMEGLGFEVRGSLFNTALLRDLYYDSKSTFNGYAVGGLAGKYSNNSNSYVIEAFASYNKNFGKNKLSTVGGYSYQTSAYRTIYAGASGFSNDILKNENLAAGTTQYPTQSNRTEDLLSSYFVRLNNTYNGKYTATFTARYDGSSKFAAANQWSFFPSGALSWRISQENFLKNSKTVSDLKFRVSYGLSGNQAVQSLQTKSTLGFNQYPYGGVLQTGVYPAVLGNPGLKWETTGQFNAGVDFGFWSQRFTGSINYYVKNTKDLLQNMPLPANSGYTTQLANVGSISNKGIELEIRAAIVDKGDFKWDVNANIAINRQKVTNLGLGALDTLLQFQPVHDAALYTALITGQPVGLFFGYVSDGLFRTAAELANGPALAGSKVGTRRFKDLNNDGLINDLDRRVIGDPNPDFTFGISNNFSYKGFDLNFLVQGTVGGDMYNVGDYLQQILGNRSKAALDYFTPTNTDAKYPAPGQNVGRTLFNDLNVESASFLRLKSLNIGYNLPAGKVKFVRSIRIYASGTNLLTITNYSGPDPEVNSLAQSNLFRNIDALTIPLYKTYTIGLNVGF